MKRSAVLFFVCLSFIFSSQAFCQEREHDDHEEHDHHDHDHSHQHNEGCFFLVGVHATNVVGSEFSEFQGTTGAVCNVEALDPLDLILHFGANWEFLPSGKGEAPLVPIPSLEFIPGIGLGNLRAWFPMEVHINPNLDNDNGWRFSYNTFILAGAAFDVFGIPLQMGGGAGAWAIDHNGSAYNAGPALYLVYEGVIDSHLMIARHFGGHSHEEDVHEEEVNEHDEMETWFLSVGAAVVFD